MSDEIKKIISIEKKDKKKYKNKKLRIDFDIKIKC